MIDYLGISAWCFGFFVSICICNAQHGMYVCTERRVGCRHGPIGLTWLWNVETHWSLQDGVCGVVISIFYLGALGSTSTDGRWSSECGSRRCGLRMGLAQSDIVMKSCI